MKNAANFGVPRSLSGPCRNARTDLGPDADWASTDSIHEEAAQLLPSGSPEWTRIRTNLGTSPLTRYGARDDGSDLDQAVAVFTQTVSATTDTSPNLPIRLNNLGVALKDRFECTGDERDRDTAVQALRRAAAIGLEGDIHWGLSAAYTWGRWSPRHDQRAETVEEYRLALTAGQRCVQVQLLRRSTGASPRQLRAVHVDAAETLAYRGLAAETVVAVEQGRAVLLSQALGLERAELNRLAEAGREDLITRFGAAGGRLAGLVKA